MRSRTVTFVQVRLSLSTCLRARMLSSVCSLLDQGMWSRVTGVRMRGPTRDCVMCVSTRSRTKREFPCVRAWVLACVRASVRPCVTSMRLGTAMRALAAISHAQRPFPSSAFHDPRLYTIGSAGRLGSSRPGSGPGNLNFFIKYLQRRGTRVLFLAMYGQFGESPSVNIPLPPEKESDSQ